MYKERIQLFLLCKDLKSNSLKSSEILIDFLPILSEKYKHCFSLLGETSGKVLSPSFYRPFYPRK